MKLSIVCALMTIAAGAPGLLRIPKVYNAVITSNQNLSPSRAFPVIQPVIHRTAIGYVPPFYYAHYPLLVAKPSTKDQDPSSSSRLVESTSFGIGRDRDQREKIAGNSSNGDAAKENPPAKKRKHEQALLSFYPSFPAASIYYHPYVYVRYNGSVNRHLVPPGTYYIDYQPYGLPLKPIPASAPNSADSGHPLPSSHDEKTDQAKIEWQTIPDVPPPPLPTSPSNGA